MKKPPTKSAGGFFVLMNLAQGRDLLHQNHLLGVCEVTSSQFVEVNTRSDVGIPMQGDHTGFV